MWKNNRNVTVSKAIIVRVIKNNESNPDRPHRRQLRYYLSFRRHWKNASFMRLVNQWKIYVRVAKKKNTGVSTPDILAGSQKSVYCHTAKLKSNRRVTVFGPLLMHYVITCLESLRKPPPKPQDGQSPGRDLNPSLPKHETRDVRSHLTTHTFLSVRERSCICRILESVVSPQGKLDIYVVPSKIINRQNNFPPRTSFGTRRWIITACPANIRHDHSNTFSITVMLSTYYTA
jgi:hypothetical protein